MLVRALIVLLLVLNAGAAAWWIGHRSVAAQAPTHAPAGVARLQLVSERTVAAPPPVANAAAQETPVSVAEAPGAPQCYRFGPFATRDAGAAASARLKPLVRSLSVREQPAANAGGRGWRVFLPPQASLEQAQAMADRIGAAGFTDFLVVREGAEANAIALGRYGSEQAAMKRAEALNAAGFAAQAEALGARESAFWIEAVADAGFDARRAQALMTATQQRSIACSAQR